MSTNRARSAALVLSAFIVWPFLSNAASAAMLLSSTANPSSAAAGDRVRFAATVSNTGTTVQAVALTAVVPVSTTVSHSELSFAAYCNGASSYTVCTAGQTLQFVAFNVPAGGSVTVVYPALVSSSPAPADGTKLTSTATATIGTSKLQATAFATASASAHASLRLTSSALPAQVRAGGTLTYTLTFGNAGSAAVAANLTLPLPAGTTFVSASDGGTSSGDTVTWSLGTVAAGSAARRSAVLQVASTAAAGSQLFSDASLRNPTTQAVLVHAALTTPVGASPASTLNVRAVATPDPVAAGQRVNYAVTVSNTATATHAVLVAATVPLNTTVAHNELSFAAYCDGASSYVTCTAGQVLQFVAFNVTAGGSVTVVYPALVSSTAPPNGTLVNSDVWVQDSTAIDDYQVNVAAVAQSTATSGLHVTTSALPAQVRAGGTLTYTLTFANPGSAAVAANLTLPLPAGTTFVSASDGGTSSGGTVTWSLGTVAAGSAARRSVVLTAASTAVAGTQLPADAALRNPTTQAVIAHAALTTPVGASPASTLNVRAVATPDPVAAGQRVRYAVTVSNTATATHAVLVTATVPLNSTVAHNELSFAAYCDGASSYVTCTAGQVLQFVAFNVTAGGSVTVVYPALVSSTAPPNGTLVNSDVWVQDGTAIDDYQVNVAAVAQSTAVSGLHVTTSALPAQVRAGGTLTYTLTFANPGSAAVAANLTLPLPAGTTFVSASDGGTSSGGTVTWSLGTVAAGSAGRRSVVLTVASTAVAGAQLPADAALRNPTTQAVLAHAALTTPVGASPASTLNVRAVATPDPVAAGQRVNYAVTVSNTATATHAVLVTATVPLNTTVAHNELSFAAYCDGASSYTSCTAGQVLQFVAFNVPAGGSVTVVYPALVSSTAPPNGTLVNSDVWVQDSTAIDDYQVNVAAVAQSTATSGVHVMTSALPAQVRAGAALTYTLTFGNPGSAAVAANLTLPLPAGTTFVSASNGGTNSGGTVTWSLGTLPAGSAGRRSMVVQVASTAVAGTQLAGDAALRSPTTQAVIAHAALTTPVGASPVSMLNVQAVAAPDPVAAGQKVTYSLTVSNTATAAHAVLVTATVPLNTSVTHTDLTLAAYCDGASSYTACAAGQTLQFVAFNVAASGSVTVKVPALVSGIAPPNGTLLNSDFWVQDGTSIDDYQVKVAAVAGLKTIVVAPMSQLSPVGFASVSALAARAPLAGSTLAARTGPAAAAGSRTVGHGAAITADATAAAPARYIIALDDVLAAGEGETSATQDRWPAFLAQRVRTEFPVPSDLMVVEPGVGIGRHALDLSRAMTRLEPGILARNGAKFVIVLDDIEASPIPGAHEAVTVERIIAWHRQNIEQAHALGLKVIGGTVTAFEGARIPTHTESSEANREAVNAWTRNGKAYDGVVDFDLATRDPKHPTRLLPAYDSGDHLHPNEAGYKAMAEAIDLSLFDE